MYLTDNQGRKIDYLRVSVTDRCNLRCKYCMPAHGIDDMGHDHILRYHEILRLISVFSCLGIKKIKITGGEPLVRKNVEDLAAYIRDIKGIEEVTLTTNGLLLEEKFLKLYDAGIRKINISLDTVNREKYKELTGFDCLEKVIRGITKAAEHDEMKLKINSLILKETSCEEIEELVNFAQNNGIIPRFIEVMPIGMGKNIATKSREEVLKILQDKWGDYRICNGKWGNGPAVYFQFEKLKEKIGFISPLSHKFCSGCNRLRLTADGILKPCLNYDSGINLKDLLRSGKSDEDIARSIKRSIWIKPQGHCFGEEENIREQLRVEKRTMSRIGG